MTDEIENVTVQNKRTTLKKNTMELKTIWKFWYLETNKSIVAI